MRGWPGANVLACGVLAVGVLPVLLLGTGAHASMLHTHAAGCASTAEAAVQAYLLRSAAADTTASTIVATPGAVRVAGERRDALNGTRWLVVKRCDGGGLEQLVATLAERSGSQLKAQERQDAEMLVRAGEAVQLQDADAASSTVLTGVAVASGSAGDTVRVRLRSFSLDGGPGMVVEGRVMGRGVVLWMR